LSDHERRYVKSEDFLSRRVGDTVALIPGAAGSDLSDIYTLTPVGAAVWAQIDGETTVGEIAAGIADTFGISNETAQKDVDAFVRQLRRIHAIQVVA